MKTAASASINRPRGRPRGFSRATALDKAMRVFWTRGYEAASIAELASAMSINPPSLYAAFGDKRALFVEALALYQDGPGDYVRAALENPTLSATEAVRAMLEGAVESFTCPGQPAGCMVVLAATNCGSGSADVVADLAARRHAATAAIRDRIERGVAAGELPHGTDAAALAGLVAALIYGMTIQARDGAGRQALAAVVEAFMQRWP